MPPFVFNATPLTVRQRHLAACNVGLVFTVVFELVHSDSVVTCLGEDDAVGEGMLALCKAARGFRRGRVGRKGRETRFSDYAGRAIKTEVRRAATRWVKEGGLT